MHAACSPSMGLNRAEIRAMQPLNYQNTCNSKQGPQVPHTQAQIAPGSSTSIQEIMKTTGEFLRVSHFRSIPSSKTERSFPGHNPSKETSYSITKQAQLQPWSRGVMLASWHKRRWVLMVPWMQHWVEHSQKSTQGAGTEWST